MHCANEGVKVRAILTPYRTLCIVLMKGLRLGLF